MAEGPRLFRVAVERAPDPFGAWFLLRATWGGNRLETMTPGIHLD